VKINLLKIARTLAIAYIAFISLFSLDIFGQGYSFWETIIGLFMHLLPSFALILVLIISWKKPLTGGVLFFLIALAFTFAFRTYSQVSTFVLISAPLYIISVVYFLSDKALLDKKLKVFAKKLH
jgi:hypothetical protein